MVTRESHAITFNLKKILITHAHIGLQLIDMPTNPLPQHRLSQFFSDSLQVFLYLYTNETRGFSRFDMVTSSLLALGIPSVETQC